jgi:small nuclear ribonucleoprotein B and B'
MMDGRQMAGQMLAFDKHMNLVLADTEEFRRVKRKPNKSSAPGQADAQVVETEEKRTLGLTIVRGAHIVASSVEGPPPADPSARLAKDGPSGPGAPTMTAGPGITRPAGRGMPPTGLTGPAAGVGGPAPPGGFPGAPGGFGFPPPGFGGRGAPRMYFSLPGNCLYMLTQPRSWFRRSSSWLPWCPWWCSS